MKSEKMYSIAIRKRNGENDFFWNHDNYIFEELSIDCENRYWLADPFLFEKEGKDYVFYEAFDLIERKGKIGFSVLNENSKELPIHIILDEPYHMSFPYIFEYGGNIFIMPETCDDNAVKLFKAVFFPDLWEEYGVVRANVHACDSIILKDLVGNEYLLANETYRDQTPNGNFASCWLRNVLYKLDKDLRAGGKGILVTEGDCGIRNAGNSIRCNGRLYRVGQNCPNKQYGKGLVLFEVESIDPYREKLLWIKDCEDFDCHIQKLKNTEIIGIHTYNISNNYEIIDFSQIRDWNYITLFLKKKKDISCWIINLKRKILYRFKRLLWPIWNTIRSCINFERNNL